MMRVRLYFFNHFAANEAGMPLVGMALKRVKVREKNNYKCD